MIEVANLSAFYGKHRALDGVSLTVAHGEIIVILGANGAGKTTLLKAIGGLVPIAPGARISMAGRDIAAMPAHEIVEAGVALVPEGRGIFGELSVRENLLLGAYPARARANEAANLAMVFGLFPRLQERLRQPVRTMSGGEQQMVAVARAMVSAPRLLMLDEPSLGLAPKMVDELLATARRIADAGTTVLMVEQNIKKALAVADRGYVLERGTLVASGSAKLLARSTVVREAYLGAAESDTTTAADAAQRRRATTRTPA